MTIAPQKPWSAEQFLSWLNTQEARFEYDGIQPVAMTGGNARHNRIMTNIHAALRARLRGTKCSFYGPDLGVQTIGEVVRFPDALVTCTKFPGTDRLAPGVVVIFEVLSPTSGQTDRITKVGEYARIPSMRRYVIVESRFAGLLVLHRDRADDPWIATALSALDTLQIPELSLAIPVTEFYEDIAFEGVPSIEE